MNETAFTALFLVAFPLFWFLVTTLLRHMSGLPALEERFPDHGEPGLRRLRFQSGMMGEAMWSGVNYGGCLTLDVCRSGLRVKVWRLFSPLGRPFLAPWAEIVPREKRILFFRHVRLGFGRTRETGSLTISRRTFAKIASEGYIAEP